MRKRAPCGKDFGKTTAFKVTRAKIWRSISCYTHRDFLNTLQTESYCYACYRSCCPSTCMSSSRISCKNPCRSSKQPRKDQYCPCHDCNRPPQDQSTCSAPPVSFCPWTLSKDICESCCKPIKKRVRSGQPNCTCTFSTNKAECGFPENVGKEINNTLIGMNGVASADCPRFRASSPRCFNQRSSSPGQCLRSFSNTKPPSLLREVKQYYNRNCNDSSSYEPCAVIDCFPPQSCLLQKRFCPPSPSVVTPQVSSYCPSLKQSPVSCPPPQVCYCPTCCPSVPPPECKPEPRQPICYPPISCSEPPPKERICYYPNTEAGNSKTKCYPCGGSGGGGQMYSSPSHKCDYHTSCPNRGEIQDTPCCRRCGRKVYLAERVSAAGGGFHTCCFSCYYCKKPLEITTICEHRGEIYCKCCYFKYFGTQGYGYGTSLRTPI